MKFIQETLNVDRYVKADKFYPGDLKTKKDPRPFKNTFCSQCGGKFGPGMSGYSHCKDHKGVKRVSESLLDGAARKLEEQLQFFVDPFGTKDHPKFAVMNMTGDIHDVYDDKDEASKVVKKLNKKYALNEDWGSSDWTAAVNHFVGDIGNYNKEDGVSDILQNAYEVANFYNDDRQYQNDDWSHFSPKSLVQMALSRGQIPEDKIEDANALLRGEFPSNHSGLEAEFD